MGTRWPKSVSTAQLWEVTGEKPVMLQIGMRKWRWIGHTVRKGDESIEKQALNCNSQGARRTGRPKQPGKGPFWRKQENAAKYGTRLRVWWETVRWRWAVLLVGQKIYSAATAASYCRYSHYYHYYI